jgi:ribulose 1,5-bisphosphate synthetase/thiazole synthase
VIRGLEEFATSTTIETDVVVVGAGPIGIVTALELAKSGVQVAHGPSGAGAGDFRFAAGRLLPFAQ